MPLAATALETAEIETWANSGVEGQDEVEREGFERDDGVVLYSGEIVDELCNSNAL